MQNVCINVLVLCILHDLVVVRPATWDFEQSEHCRFVSSFCTKIVTNFNVLCYWTFRKLIFFFYCSKKWSSTEGAKRSQLKGETAPNLQ